MNVKVTSIFFVVLMMLLAEAARAWEVDFSHHRKPVSEAPPQVDPATPSASVEAKKESAKSLDGLVARTHSVVSANVDRQEFVILNTAKGFVPSQVRVKKGVHYTVHIVNVNENKKNVSFIMDGFNQHYGTYYGEIKSFNLDPDKEGVYEFECPETASAGKLVVFGPNGASPVDRHTASFEKHGIQSMSRDSVNAAAGDAGGNDVPPPPME
jgi:plastocyanin